MPISLFWLGWIHVVPMCLILINVNLVQQDATIQDIVASKYILNSFQSFLFPYVQTDTSSWLTLHNELRKYEKQLLFLVTKLLQKNRKHRKYRGIKRKLFKVPLIQLHIHIRKFPNYRISLIF
jgi:hypothetical protein